MACREGDETSMLVECNSQWCRIAAIERRDVMALGSERLQSAIETVSDDDSALVVDAHSLKMNELARLLAFGAELEQERAIDRRQYLHSMACITDDDSMSIIIDRNARWILEYIGILVVGVALEQERQIDRRQEHQSIVA